VVVDGGGEGAFGAVLADDEGVEVVFEGGGPDGGWLVGVFEWAFGWGACFVDYSHKQWWVSGCII
jgi:hypothetical protein